MGNVEAVNAIDEVLARGLVHSVFQPIVDLDTGVVVGYEALARGPHGALERPDLMFDAARTAGRLIELDELCRRTALTSAIAAGILAPLTVFVNVEPEALDSTRLDELVGLANQARGTLQVVLEITERAIAARPAELLATVQRLRAAGWRIALDDVGADDMSLAFMPLLLPDIVKLDLSLVQKRPGPAVAQIMNAVNAYAEQSGALLLAEGIEDEGHLQVARALGARLGQGWMFGRPSPSMASSSPPGSLDLPPSQFAALPSTPFGALTPDVPLRRSTKPLLIELSKFLERGALRFGTTGVVVAAFQHAKHFTPATAHRYRELAERVGFVAAIGEGLGDEPVRGVRGADLESDDPIRGEWNIIVLAPHFAAALLARDLGDTGPDQERTFEFALTYDRSIVSVAAQTLLSRVSSVQAEDFAPAQHLSAPALPVTGSRTVSDVATAATVADRLPTTAERTLRRALAATTNGVSIVDVTRADHPLVYVNTAFERLSGLRVEDVLGRNCRLLQGPETDAAAVNRIRDAISDGREIRETLINYRGEDRSPWWNEIYLAPVFEDDGSLVQYIGIQTDVTDRITAQQGLQAERARTAHYVAEVETLAFTDPLTGAWNRRRLHDLLESAVLEARMSDGAFAVLYLDIDHFKTINDRYGHAAGDLVLTTTAARLRARLRRGDILARLGGDEFLVILPGLEPGTVMAEANGIAESFAESLREPISLLGHSATTHVSIGVSSYPHDGDTFDSLVHAADARIYSQKQSARSSLAR